MKELIITPPEGYEIDQENSTLEKIVFKPIDIKPRSWEEYCKNHEGDFYYITSDAKISGLGFNPKRNPLDVDTGKNALPSKEYAEAFLVLMQIVSLRDSWIHIWSVEQKLSSDWVPDWSSRIEKKYVIQCEENELCIDTRYTISRPLSFPTQKMAEEFLVCFKNLIKQAKLLI